MGGGSVDSLHAAGVELAARHRHANHTGGEGQEQRVARPVQSQRQELPGLRRVFNTPEKHTHTHTLNICLAVHAPAGHSHQQIPGIRNEDGKCRQGRSHCSDSVRLVQIMNNGWNLRQASAH